MGDYRDAARRGEGFHRSRGGKAFAGDKFTDAALQLFRGGADHARGNFFGTDL